jgi:hexosaminidase
VELRTHAERAIVLIAEARAANPHFREADALTAMDLGARRLDLIGMKFQLGEEIAEAYEQGLTQQHDPAKAREMRTMLSEISGINGRCQDLRDAYSALKEEYSQVWLSENRPYWLNNVTVRYDLRIEAWQARAERFSSVVKQFAKGKELPSAAELGLPAVRQSSGQ